MRIDGARFADAVVSSIGTFTFLALQNVAIAAWGLWAAYHQGFDPGLLFLNLALSMQAAQTASLTIKATKRQEAVQRQQLKYLLNTMEAVHALLVAGTRGPGETSRVGLGASEPEAQ